MVHELSRYVDNDGVSIHYLDSGSASESPIVFVPGMSDLAVDYADTLGAFGRRIIVIDLRGHGPSESPDTGYTLNDQASDIDAVVSAVTDGPVHLTTFSRGTCYGLAWASTQPDRVLSMSIGDYPAREIDLPTDAVRTFRFRSLARHPSA